MLNGKVARKIRNVQLIRRSHQAFIKSAKSLSLKKKYYLDGEYAPSRGFVKEKLMHVDSDKIQYPPQRILSENRPNQLVHTKRVSGKLKAEECHGKTHQWEKDRQNTFLKIYWVRNFRQSS